jgi:TolB-like protein/DNA-binding winged helix-turn-helix (wHTH) protein
MFPKISSRFHRTRRYSPAPDNREGLRPSGGRCITIGAVTELPHQFELDDLRVDLWSQRVTRGETPIPLPKLSFELLVALARAAPKLVSIDELMTQVWPGLVVNPETVAQRVKMLRDALGDEPRTPRYIESVRSRGYRLLHEPKTAPQPGTASLKPSAGTNRRRLLAGLLGLVLLIAAVMSIRLHHSAGPAAKSVLPERTVAVLPFTAIGGESKDALLASGIAENIRLRLGGLSELVVIEDASIAGYNGTHVDAATVGRELNARYLLEGSLQRQNELMRITARLVDAQNRDDV